jgi:hypothetical protein
MDGLTGGTLGATVVGVIAYAVHRGIDDRFDRAIEEYKTRLSQLHPKRVAAVEALHELLGKIYWAMYDLAACSAVAAREPFMQCLVDVELAVKDLDALVGKSTIYFRQELATQLESFPATYGLKLMMARAKVEGDQWTEETITDLLKILLGSQTGDKDSWTRLDELEVLRVRIVEDFRALLGVERKAADD